MGRIDQNYKGKCRLFCPFCTTIFHCQSPFSVVRRYLRIDILLEAQFSHILTYILSTPQLANQWAENYIILNSFFVEHFLIILVRSHYTKIFDFSGMQHLFRIKEYWFFILILRKINFYINSLKNFFIKIYKTNSNLFHSKWHFPSDIVKKDTTTFSIQVLTGIAIISLHAVQIPANMLRIFALLLLDEFILVFVRIWVVCTHTMEGLI